MCGSARRERTSLPSYRGTTSARNGTSFAAALVSAAVWLAKQANGDLAPDAIRMLAHGGPPARGDRRAQIAAGSVTHRALESRRRVRPARRGEVDSSGRAAASNTEITAAQGAYRSSTAGVAAFAASPGGPDTHRRSARMTSEGAHPHPRVRGRSALASCERRPTVALRGHLPRGCRSIG